MIRQSLVLPRRSIQHFTPAVGAAIIQQLATLRAEGAFKRADEGPALIGRQIDAAALAIGAHLKHWLAPLLRWPPHRKCARQGA